MVLSPLDQLVAVMSSTKFQAVHVLTGPATEQMILMSGAGNRLDADAEEPQGFSAFCFDLSSTGKGNATPSFLRGRLSAGVNADPHCDD
ncbi:MAG: hypothetical protein ACRDJE_12595 [Dehalococcoidia bacterium]